MDKVIFDGASDPDQNNYSLLKFIYNGRAIEVSVPAWVSAHILTSLESGCGRVDSNTVRLNEEESFFDE